jgi:hypothetical protein
MFSILYALGMAIGDLVKSRARLEAEILLLRHQLNLALRHAPPRVRLHRGDRAFMIWMVRLWPSLLDVVQLFSRRPCCAGTGLVSVFIGAGSHESG